MKVLLIILFIALFTYLVLYICGFLENPAGNRNPKRPRDLNGSLASRIDHLAGMTDRQLLLLKDDLIALRNMLDQPVSSVSSWMEDHPRSSPVGGMFRFSLRLKDSAWQEAKRSQLVRNQLVIIQSTLILVVIALMWI